MKTIWGFAFFVLSVVPASAQLRLSGTVQDARTGTPLAGASVDFGTGLSTATDDSGRFVLQAIKPASFRVRISNIGYQALDTLLTIDQPGPLHFRLNSFGLFMTPIEVRAVRAGDKAPFTRTNLNAAQIASNNLGQDLPFILNQTPGVVVNSDAGNGIGYTNIYIRGSDATRINMTLNGIPYNDAESQGIYFVDLPDFASSANSIQVQRGVGTSSNGAGAFGATINFSTNEFADKPYAELNNSFGSFNSWKNTIKLGSGLIGDHFTLDARLSRISSDGFIDRASTNLKALYLSAAWFTKKSSLRFNLITGTEKTYQAWNGIPQAKLEGNRAALDEHYQDNVGSLYFTTADSLNLYNSNNRTYNYFTYKNQTDNYQQDHYQLFFNHAFNEALSLNTAAFLTRGRGYYEEYKNQQAYADYGLPDPQYDSTQVSTTDLIRQKWLDNYFYGGIFSLQYKEKSTQLTLGGGWYRYDGGHYGQVIWAQHGGVPDDYRYYNSPAYKTDANVYGKWQQALSSHWNFFADLQYRNVQYEIDGFDENPAIHIRQNLHFFNPKIGISFTHQNLLGYFSFSQASHEPNRADYEAGVNELPKPETLRDLELGVQVKSSGYSWGATAYYMQYKDQLVLTGKINDVGSYTRTNIPNSYRLGLELEGTAHPVNWFRAEGNIAISENKVLNYTEYIDDYDNGGQKTNSYSRTDISFSPPVVAAYGLHFIPLPRLDIGWLGKYVSHEYLDNAQRSDRMLQSYYVQNLQVQYRLPGKWIRETQFILQVNNLFNKQYEPNGYTYSYIYGGQLITENFLFPMAGTNFLFAVNIRL